MDIKDLIPEVIKTYQKFGSSSKEFKDIYYSNFQTLEQHKVNTLKENEGKKINVYGYLTRRGDGEDKNLNLISPIWINGVQVEHLHVYDGVIEALENSQEINANGMFATNSLEVFSYLRKSGSKAYGLKPVAEDVGNYCRRIKN